MPAAALTATKAAKQAAPTTSTESRPLTNVTPINVDFVEAGSVGPVQSRHPDRVGECPLSGVNQLARIAASPCP